MSTQVPVLEQEAIEKVTITKEDIDSAPATAPVASVGLSKELVQEATRRAAHVAQIKAFVVSDGDQPAPSERLDPNLLVQQK